MATVFIRKYKSGKKAWYSNFTVRGDRKKIKVEAQNKTQAIKMARKLEEDFINRKYDFIDKRPPLSFGELSQRYISFAKDHKKSWDRDVVSLKNITKMIINNKRFGDYHVSDITTFHVQKYQIQRKREVDKRLEKKGIAVEDRNFATVNRELACLKTIFYCGKDWDLLEKNPVASKSIKFFPEKRRERYLSESELKNILSVSSGYLRNIIIIAINTGMRSGEIFNLKWQNIDYTLRRIHVTNTKTNKDRFIPINDYLFATFQSIENGGEYLFTNRFGKPFGSIKNSFKKVLNQANISSFRMHDCRHTYATYLANNGVDEITISELLGHSRGSITSRYSHAIWGRKVEAVKIIGMICLHAVSSANIIEMER